MCAFDSTIAFPGPVVVVDGRVVRPYAVLAGIGIAYQTDGTFVLLAIETSTRLSYRVPIQQPSLFADLVQRFQKSV